MVKTVRTDITLTQIAVIISELSNQKPLLKVVKYKTEKTTHKQPIIPTKTEYKTCLISDIFLFFLILLYYILQEKTYP